METDRANATSDRRNPVVIRYEIDSDPRRLRTVLQELEARLVDLDPHARRCVRLLATEVISRWLDRDDLEELGDVGIECNVQAGTVRLDVSCDRDPGMEFWTTLGETVAADLVQSWGVDRRAVCGAWFEIAREPPARDAT